MIEANRYSRQLAGSVICFLLTLGVSGVVYSATSPYAETVILNGHVITADSDDPEEVSIQEAIAIRGDRILAVGTNDEIRGLIADWTEVIDAGGNSVVPGFIDTHNHIYEGTNDNSWVINRTPELLMIDIRSGTIEEMASAAEQVISARARQMPEGNWIRVSANPPEVAVHAFGDTITRASLDRVAPNHPASVRTRGGTVLNSLAIEAFETYYGTRMPDAYWMEDRDLGWSGEYTDFSRCSGIDLIGTKQGNFNNYIQGYFEVMQGIAQSGITTHKTHLQCEGGFSASVHLDRNDLLPLRFAWAHRWMQPFNDRITETYRRIGDWTGYGSDFMWSIGSSVGGIDAGGVGWCTSMIANNDSIKGREQCPPAPGLDLSYITELNTVPNRGRRVEHLNTLTKLAAEGRITGIPGWHVSGDGGQDVLFNTYRNYMSDERILSLRIQSDHCHTVRPDQIELAARLGHTFACNSGSTPTRIIKEGYSDEYLAWVTPVGSMLRAGVNTVLHDFGRVGVSAFNPQWLTGIDASGEPWGVPENVVPDRMTFLLMLTRYGAYPLWKEDELGSIEPGKMADIVILNGNYLDTPVEDLDEMFPVMTMIGGRVSFEDTMLRGNRLGFNTETADWTVEMNTPTDVWRWQEAPQIPPFLTGTAGGR